MLDAGDLRIGRTAFPRRRERVLPGHGGSSRGGSVLDRSPEHRPTMPEPPALSNQALPLGLDELAKVSPCGVHVLAYAAA